MIAPSTSDGTRRNSENVAVVIELSGGDRIHSPGPRMDGLETFAMPTHSDADLSGDLEQIRKVAEANSIPTSLAVQDISPTRHILSPNRRMADHFDGGVDTHIIQTAVLTLTSIPVAVASIQLLRQTIVEWIKGRATRHVKVKLGGVTVEVKGTSDIDNVIQTLEQKGHLAENQAKRGAKPNRRPPSAKQANKALKRTRPKKRRAA